MSFASGGKLKLKRPIIDYEGKIVHSGKYDVVEKWEKFLLIENSRGRYKIPNRKIYNLTRSDFPPVGKHNHISDDEFDPKELEMGIEVEFEHTNDPEIAKAIAKDHLAECSDYYTRLAEMERECENEKYRIKYVYPNIYHPQKRY